MFYIKVNGKPLRAGSRLGLVMFSTLQEAKKYVADNSIKGKVKIIKMSERLLEMTEIDRDKYDIHYRFGTKRIQIPTPEKLKKFMLDSKYSEADIAIMTNVTQRTVRRWLVPANQKNAQPIPWSAWMLLLIKQGKIDRSDFLNYVIRNINTKNKVIPWAELVLILYASRELTTGSLDKLMEKKARNEGRVLGKKKKVGRPPKKS